MQVKLINESRLYISRRPAFFEDLELEDPAEDFQSGLSAAPAPDGSAAIQPETFRRRLGAGRVRDAPC